MQLRHYADVPLLDTNASGAQNAAYNLATCRAGSSVSLAASRSTGAQQRRAFWSSGRRLRPELGAYMPRPSTLTLAALARPARPGRFIILSRLSILSPFGLARALFTSMATWLVGRRT